MSNIAAIEQNQLLRLRWLGDRFFQLRVILGLVIVDSLSSWLLIVMYLTGHDFTWLVNVNFLVMTGWLALCAPRRFNSGLLMWIFLVAAAASVVKMFFLLSPERSFGFYHIATYWYGLLMPLFAIAFVSRFNESDQNRIADELVWFAKRFLVFALPGLLAYSLLFFLGYIQYFGMGLNLYYAYPHLVIGKTLLPTLFFLVICLISGKRATLLALLAQMLFRHVEVWRRNLVALITTCVVALLVVYGLYEYTGLLDRFKWILHGSYDWTSPKFLETSAGGRFEEIFGIYGYFVQHPFEALFGSPPGSYYSWARSWSDEIIHKNYAHLTWAGYVFRYGVVFTIPLFFYFLWALLKDLGSSGSLYITFVGIFTVSFFGALMVSDPASWLFLALFFRLGRRVGGYLPAGHNELGRTRGFYVQK